MKAQTRWFLTGPAGLFLILVGLLIFSSFSYALPSAPVIQYVTNTTAATALVNRSGDMPGTITTILLSANQQDYKWKAYVGNVTGKLALDDANGKSIYDWDLGTAGGGEVYVSRNSGINWATVGCVNEAVLSAEQAQLGIAPGLRDSINRTFNETTHVGFTVATTPVSGCRSTATYIDDTPQIMSSSAHFQEILLRDTTNSYMIYSTIMSSAQRGFNNQTYDFQLLVAENESATVPTPYFFWVELG